MIIVEMMSLHRPLSHRENITHNRLSFVRHFHEEERICFIILVLMQFKQIQL